MSKEIKGNMFCRLFDVKGDYQVLMQLKVKEDEDGEEEFVIEIKSQLDETATLKMSFGYDSEEEAIRVLNEQTQENAVEYFQGMKEMVR